MTLIKSGGIFPMDRVQEINGQIEISNKGIPYSSINKLHGRFSTIELVSISKIVILDLALNNEFVSDTNKLKDDLNAVISNTGNNITDENAVDTYLSGFIGV